MTNQNKIEDELRPLLETIIRDLELNWAIIVVPDENGHVLSAYSSKPETHEFTCALFRRMFRGIDHVDITKGRVEA